MLRSSLHRSHARGLVIIGTLSTLTLMACGLDGVVGGDCKSGYVEVGGQCVPSGGVNGVGGTPTQDLNPTEPGSVGPSSEPSTDGGGSRSDSGADDDASSRDDGGDGGDDLDAGRDASGAPDGGSGIDPDSGSNTSDGGATSDDAGANANDAGANASDAGANASDAGANASDAGSPLVCQAPLVACRGNCISVDADPQNCGACGRICPSNICAGGVCQGATPGDIVVIGHDMSAAWSGSVQAKVLTNAITIPTTEPIRVLSYEVGVDAATATNTRDVIRANVTNRTVAFTSATEDLIDSPSLYAAYDVVLVQGAPAAGVPALGGRWATPLQTFTKSGGVFIALDSGLTDVPTLVTSAGLLTVGGHQVLGANAQFNVTAANDVVGAKLLSPYSSFGASVGFTGVEPETSDVRYVVRWADVTALPIVIHKTARP